jgi:hypothetical protein
MKANAAETIQKNIGGNLEQEVANEEQSRAQPKSGFTQTKCLVHVQLGEADIDAIEIGYEIAQDQERNEPRHHLADDTFLDVSHGAASLMSLKARSETWGLKFCKTMAVTDDGCKWHLNGALRSMAKIATTVSFGNEA